jgi:RimJ/RimL family protein N-acetyltransferase
VFRIDWANEVGALAAIEPQPAEVVAHSAELAVGYNEPDNARLMGHEDEIDPDEVVEHYEDMAAAGARQFLLFVDGKLVGDADLRGIDNGACEFAFMIGARDQQGKGLGTKFALMIYSCAFRELGLRRVYASLVPHNAASRRVFEKLGCTLDESDEARSYADEPGDIVMGIDREVFERANAAALANISVSAR